MIVSAWISHYFKSVPKLQFAMLESSSVDDDLAKLKKELSGSSKVCLIMQDKYIS